jgi:hypothetical protein
MIIHFLSLFLWFELRTFHLLGRCSTTWASLPAIFIVLSHKVLGQFVAWRQRTHTFRKNKRSYIQNNKRSEWECTLPEGSEVQESGIGLHRRRKIRTRSMIGLCQSKMQIWRQWLRLSVDSWSTCLNCNIRFISLDWPFILSKLQQSQVYLKSLTVPTSMERYMEIAWSSSWHRVWDLAAKAEGDPKKTA